MSAALTFVAFWGLFAHAASRPAGRAAMRAKPLGDWALECVNLFVQGALIPLVLVVVVARLWGLVLPTLGGAVHLHPALAFAASFVAVDYAYYWNHRLLHTRPLWPLHAVHHSATAMDVFATSRNTVWTSFLIVYLWAGALFLHLLDDPTFYLAGAAATAILDLWRHSALDLPRRGLAGRVAGWLLVTPRDHAWHHATDAEPGNYGANFTWWDRLHRTYLGVRPAPASLGVRCDLTLTRRLAWPFEKRT